jgi:hypothetical protein
MNLPPPKVCRRMHQLFAMMGSSNANEAANARDKLTKLLGEHGLSWNDLSAILAASEPKSSNAHAANAQPSAPQGPTSAPEINVLDLTLYLIDEHIAITAEERMALALWVLHTHVFDQFTNTPRLALLSPVRGCGKTTLLCSSCWSQSRIAPTTRRRHRFTICSIIIPIPCSSTRAITSVCSAMASCVRSSTPDTGGVVASLALAAAGRKTFQLSLRSPWQQSARCRCRCCTALC